MALHESQEKMKFDKRLIDFYLKHGLLTQKELDEYLKNLPDTLNNSSAIELANDQENW